MPDVPFIASTRRDGVREGPFGNSRDELGFSPAEHIAGPRSSSRAKQRKREGCSMRFSTLLTCLSASAIAMAAHAQDMQAPPAGEPMTQPGAGPAPMDPPPPPPPPAASPPGGMSGDMATPPPPPGPPPPPPPEGAAPPPDGMAPPPPPPPPPVAGGQIEMQAPAPVAQAAPPPPAEYPVCSRTVKDACRNPGSK